METGSETDLRSAMTVLTTILVAKKAVWPQQKDLPAGEET